MRPVERWPFAAQVEPFEVVEVRVSEGQYARATPHAPLVGAPPIVIEWRYANWYGPITNTQRIEVDAARIEFADQVGTVVMAGDTIVYEVRSTLRFIDGMY